MADSRSRHFPETTSRKGMTLPFEPLTLAFEHVYYSVDMPQVRFCPALSAHLTFSQACRAF